jgi:hypothetical protein
MSREVGSRTFALSVGQKTAVMNEQKYVGLKQWKVTLLGFEN